MSTPFQRAVPVRTSYREWMLALALSLMLLAIPAAELAATLSILGNRTEVSKAVSEGMAAAPVRREVLSFAVGLVVLHVGLAALVVLLARCSRTLSRERIDLNAGVVLWFCLAAASILALNAYWFPRSESGSYYHELSSTEIFGLPAALLIARLVGALALAVFIGSLWTKAASGRHHAINITTLSAIAFGAISCSAIGTDASGPGRSTAATQKPHVIIIGIDSLRLEELGRNGGSGLTPNIDGFLEKADVFADATTPVARTFPSWVAILTGRSPRDTGAVFNLVPRDKVSANPTIADALRTAGYRTVLATDEVRFSNIDESYGFDQLVTPPIGAADFLMGKITDLPLTNVVANTRLGKTLFPHTYANRGAAMLFDPPTFVRRIGDEVDFDQPTLLVTHFCAAHWPYFHAGVPEDADRRDHPDDRPLYEIGLRAADAMFGELVETLRRRGVLENALVVVLSDHGEALSVPGDSLVNDDQLDHIVGLKVPLHVMDWGHGQSVLSPVQYRVLLAFRTFGDSVDYRAQGHTFAAPVTVLDLKPTVLDLLNIGNDSRSGYAVSLRPILQGHGDDIASLLNARPRFTETDLRAAGDGAGNVDEDAAARENSMYFEVDRTTGRLELRTSAYRALMALKERAVILGPDLLAALPADVGRHQYVLLNSDTRRGSVFDTPPRPGDEPAYTLWTHLHREFPGELLPPMVLEPDKLPAASANWSAFIANERAVALGGKAGPAQ